METQWPPDAPPLRTCYFNKEFSKELGVVFTRGMVILHIYKNTPGYRSSLKVGDQILAVDGVNIEKFSFHQALTTFVKGPNKVTLLIVDSEEYRKYNSKDAVEQFLKSPISSQSYEMFRKCQLEVSVRHRVPN